MSSRSSMSWKIKNLHLIALIACIAFLKGAQADSHESVQQTTKDIKDQHDLVDETLPSGKPIEAITEFIEAAHKPDGVTDDASQMDDSTHKLNDDFPTLTEYMANDNSTCEDITIPHPLICQHSKDFCKRKGYESLMKQKCPKTCGYCSSTSNITRNVMVPTEISECVDLLLNLKDGTPGCLRYKALCKHIKAGEYVRVQCPLTCGLCVPKERPTKGCYDEPYVYGVTTCQNLKSRCDLPEVKTKCPDTCGMCRPQRDIVCMDKHNSCDAKKCDESNLRLYMTDICPVTCGYCNATTGEFF